MNDIAEQRPSFFEGEVLGAADLQQLVVYLRDQSQRHLLGGHTWGIVAGLQLLEQTAPSGGIDVYLLPGCAVDGYGRGVVVADPLRLDITAFNGQPTGPVQVWIRYDQGETNAVQPGFQTCCPDTNAYTRVAESYAIEVGNLSLASQQAGISVGGEPVADARTAPQVFDTSAPVVCDASVPYQDLPLADDTKSYWLIPLGEVGWQAGTPGQFVTLVDTTDPAKVIHSRRLRRYTGVVAENVFAADGLIRLRRRTTEVAGTITQAVIDSACGAGDLTDPSHDADLEDCTEGPTPTELVWVEGKLRIIDDTRILSPGRLELRDVHSTSYYPTTTKGSTPTFLERTDYVTGTANNADLSIVIGNAAAAGTNNRLLVQRAADPVQPTPCQSVQFSTQTTLFSVLDNGNVGIGTGTPDELLELSNAGPAYLHLDDTTDTSDLYVGAGKFGGVIGTPNANDLRIRTGGPDPTDDTTNATTRAIFLSTGQVGIGTVTPDTNRALTVEASGQASVLVRTADQKHQGLLRANVSGTLIGADTTGDDLILSCDADETGKVWLKPSGYIGVNTSTPAHRIAVEDGSAADISLHKTGGARIIVGADGTGTFVNAATNDQLQIQTNDTTRVTVTAGGNVGIGTTTPGRQLDVNGDIMFGTGPKYLAVGGFENWVVVAGSIDTGGNIVFGQGFTSLRVSLGVYTIIYTYPVATTPVVTIQLVGNSVNLPQPVLTASGLAGFTVSMGLASLFDYAFNFIALMPR
ncbi:MAG TPA: hypothetical protein VH143_20905 [Kofleriaceae bacterium]|nr:hypothetical protein [Kofleriaceae bacterium]